MATSTHSVQGDVDLYSLLGVTPDATIQKIRQSYKLLALKYHPDRAGQRSPFIPDDNPNVPDAVSAFQSIVAAYAVLKDPTERHLYDQRRWVWQHTHAPAAPPIQQPTPQLKQRPSLAQQKSLKAPFLTTSSPRPAGGPVYYTASTAARVTPFPYARTLASNAAQAARHSLRSASQAPYIPQLVPSTIPEKPTVVSGRPRANTYTAGVTTPASSAPSSAFPTRVGTPDGTSMRSPRTCEAVLRVHEGRVVEVPKVTMPSKRRTV